VLLLPVGGSPLIAANIYVLSVCTSLNTMIVLLEAGIVDMLYQILTGILLSSRSKSEEQGNSPTGQGLGEARRYDHDAK
jgi:E3 ubiquitin-protein ligase TRIP12